MELRQLAAELGVTPAQVALAWLLGRNEVSAIILGARSTDQLAENLDALSLTLSAAATERLDRASQVEALPYPYWTQQRHDRDRIPE